MKTETVIKISLLLLSTFSFSQIQKVQTIQIGNTSTNSQNASAALQIDDTARGLLMPRMTTEQRNLIGLPATGLVIYNTTTNQLETNTGTPSSPVWTGSGIGPAGSNATVTASNGLTAASGNVTLGGTLLQPTTIAQGLNTLSTSGSGNVLFNSGKVGIGTTLPANTLEVAGNVGLNGPSGIDLRDLANASWKINTSYYSLNVANDNGGTFANKLTIQNGGNIGINTTSPTEILDVAGNVKFSGALMPNNTAGTSGQVLTSTGSGAAPTWSKLPTGSSSVILNSGSFERAALTGDVTASQNSNAATISPNAVTSAKIADGTIVSADLSASAGITNGQLQNNNVSINGNSVALGGSTTITALQTPSTAVTGSTTQVAVPSTTVQGAISDLATAVKTASNTNIYAADGTLAGNRTVSLGANNLVIKPSTASGLTFNSGNTPTNNRIYMPTDGVEIQSNDSDSSKAILSVMSAASERVRVTIGGNVGIGTTSPQAQLHTTGSIRFENSSFGGPANNKVLMSSDSNGTAYWSEDSVWAYYRAQLCSLTSVTTLTYGVETSLTGIVGSAIARDGIQRVVFQGFFQNPGAAGTKGILVKVYLRDGFGQTILKSQREIFQYVAAGQFYTPTVQFSLSGYKNDFISVTVTPTGNGDAVIPANLAGRNIYESWFLSFQ